MRAEEPRAELERIRTALRSAIERLTLRAVAVQVGMSPTGLHQFVAGASPYGKTRQKVRAWYYREAGFGAIPPEDALLLLRRMVGTLPEPDSGVALLLCCVEDAYVAAGMFAPGWVAKARTALASASRSSG
jgi:hypothetical protein